MGIVFHIEEFRKEPFFMATTNNITGHFIKIKYFKTFSHLSLQKKKYLMDM